MQRERNRPPQALTKIGDRHDLNRIKGSRGAELTTIIPPDMVDTVNEDLEAINRGDGTRLPDNRFEYRGRVYAWEQGSTGYPPSGPGFIVADRFTYSAIQTFVRHGGVNTRSMNELRRNPTCPRRV
ncbi:MAG: hypothetical protein ACTHQE_06745 [Thermomicrobiales bacterium]